MPSVNEPLEPRRAALEGLRLDRTDPTALHEQAAAAIRRAISDGEAGPGQRIPQARDLAAVLGIDRNTVLRALRLLRDEGLVEMGRGRAITVAGNADTGSVTTKAKELVEYARHRGYKREELIALITRLP
jgi:GntR family transcriptional regulator